MLQQRSFRVGDSIIVKQGVLCPDDPAFLLEGWQGWVTEIFPEEKTLEMKWDSVTLRAMPSEYIRRSEIEGLGWERMALDTHEIQLATPRDKPQDSDTVVAEIENHHQWDHLADYNPGISDLLGPLGDADEMTLLEAWEEHLEKVLHFPFSARVEEKLHRSPVKVGDVIEILSLAERDGKYGVLGHVKQGRDIFTLPLCELEATDHNSVNYQPLNDYVVWFANR